MQQRQRGGGKLDELALTCVSFPFSVEQASRKQRRDRRRTGLHFNCSTRIPWIRTHAFILRINVVAHLWISHLLTVWYCSLLRARNAQRRRQWRHYRKVRVSKVISETFCSNFLQLAHIVNGVIILGSISHGKIIFALQQMTNTQTNCNVPVMVTLKKRVVEFSRSRWGLSLQSFLLSRLVFAHGRLVLYFFFSSVSSREELFDRSCWLQWCCFSFTCSTLWARVVTVNVCGLHPNPCGMEKSLSWTLFGSAACILSRLSNVWALIWDQWPQSNVPSSTWGQNATSVTSVFFITRPSHLCWAFCILSAHPSWSLPSSIPQWKMWNSSAFHLANSCLLRQLVIYFVWTQGSISPLLPLHLR